MPRKTELAISDDHEQGHVDVEISFVAEPEETPIDKPREFPSDDENGKEGEQGFKNSFLELSLLRLRQLSVLVIGLSFFFFCWSILSFIIFPPLLGFYGVLSFALSGGVGAYIFSDRIMSSGMRERYTLIFSFSLNCLYCVIAAVTGLNEDYDAGYVAFAAICALVWLVLTFKCHSLLQEVQNNPDEN